LLSSSANPSLYSQAVTFTAQVTGSGGTPTGTVSFLKGTTTLATETLSGGTATFTTSSLSVGSYSITAVYSGNSSFAGSTSAVLTQTVNKATTTDTLTVSPSPATVGQPVTLTAVLAAVAPGGGTPGGVVTFRDGTTTLGMVRMSGGVATLQTTALAAGTHSLVAIWYGDSNYIGSTSPVVSETVNSASATVSTVDSLAVNTLAVNESSFRLPAPASGMVAPGMRLGDNRMATLAVDSGQPARATASEEVLQAALRTIDNVHDGAIQQAAWIADLLLIKDLT
jgi:hypothetical protein